MDRHVGPDIEQRMQRTILGISAILLLVSSAALWLWWPASEGVLAFCWRMGAVLAAAWLAYDDVQRLPNWLLLIMPVLLILLVRFPRMLLAMIPLLIAWSILRKLLPPGPA